MTSSTRLALLSLLCVTTLAACQPRTASDGTSSDDGTSSGTASSESVVTAPLSVILITVDTLRADALGFAGNERVATPVLDRMAESGRIFANAHAHNVMTLPSHTNILTGLLPYQHGVRDNGAYALAADLPTLATRLRAAGFATGAFVASYPLDAKHGLDQGFDVYDDVDIETSSLVGGLPDPRTPFGERRGDEVVARALEWWQEQAAGPRFLWLHLFDPHGPYQPPPPFDEQYRDQPYFGEVAATDGYLAPVLEPLLDAASQSALVVFTSDHGEALGDHGELTHGHFAYEPTLKVPLVLWGRDVATGLDPRPARHIDLVPTILDWLGQELPAELPGASLLRPPADNLDTYFENLAPFLNHGWAPLRGMLRDGQKMIEQPIPELYDLPTDAAEANNLATSQRGDLRRLLNTLPEESQWPPEAPELDAEQAARLQSLGYLSGGGGQRRDTFGQEDDLKKLVDLTLMMKQVVLDFHRGDFDAAIAKCRQVLARRDDMPLAYTFLTNSLIKKGDHEGALTAMRQAKKVGAANVDLKRQLGTTLFWLGRPAEAVAELKPLAEENADANTLNQLALALAAIGQFGEAITALERALEQEPSSAATFENLSFVALQMADPVTAEQYARQALSLDPDLPGSWNNLGLALYEQQKPRPALDAWRQAIQRQPGNLDTLFNLGAVAAEVGAADLARQSLTHFLQNAPAANYEAQRREAQRILAQLGS